MLFFSFFCLFSSNANIRGFFFPFTEEQLKSDATVEITDDMTEEEKHAAKLQIRRLKEAAARQAIREAKNEGEEAEMTPEEKAAKAKHEAQLAERRLHNSIVREAKKVIKDAELAGQTVDPSITEYLAPKKRGRPARAGDESSHPALPSSVPASPSDESSETSTVVGEDKSHGESKVEKKEADASKKETKATPKAKAAKPTPAAIAAAKKKAAEANAAQEEDELVDELMEEPEAAATAPTAAQPATPVRGSREVSDSRMFEESDSEASDSEEGARKEVEQPIAPPMVVSAAKKPKAKATRAAKKSA